ncbi:ferrous iron transporter A [Borreliella tanukii]|uniref:ferrous iron transporter A n=1 Tax=Borreliella tanukii TaxID=56146 RepID=UPI003AB962FC
MKLKIKYLALGLFFGFISCDVVMKGKMKEKSLGFFSKESSILGANEESVKKSINKKEVKEKIAKKEPYKHVKGLFTDNSNLLQKNVISEEGLETKLLREQLESTKGKIQKQQNEYKERIQGSLNFLSGESGESKEIVESNEFYFTIDSDLRPKSDLQTISGSNIILYDDEVEKESYGDCGKEEVLLNNRYKSYLQDVKYNVDLAVKTISKIYANYNSFATRQTRMYSTFLDASAKARARENAKKFTKEKLEKNLNTLLNYIHVSSNTATKLLYISEMHAKRKLDAIETETKTLISKIKGQSDSYEAYKAIVGPILRIKDSLKEMQVGIDGNGVWY